MSASDSKFTLSFEVFPPKNLAGSFKLWRTINDLAAYDPSFMSVTYGAGGSTRDISKAAVEVIAKEYPMSVVGHLTCQGANRADVLDVARTYLDQGASGIVALRGDIPKEQEPVEDPFESSVELIASLRELGDHKIYVGAYPHVHPDASDQTADIDFLKRKFDAGGDVGITQFFFDADDFLAFRDACAAKGIDQPIVPGILPVDNWANTKNFAARCGAKVPAWLDEAFAKYDNLDDARAYSAEMSTKLCHDLLSAGVQDLHFYTLNDARLTTQICENLGRKPSA